MTRIQPHLHHTIISNFKKKYGIELYVPAEKMGAGAGLKDGVPDDIYFCKLCSTYFNTYLVGELCVNCGDSSASTWATNVGDQKPGKLYYKRAEMIVAEYFNPDWIRKSKMSETIIYPRVDIYKELLTDYKPKRKKEEIKIVETDNKVSLF